MAKATGVLDIYNKHLYIRLEFYHFFLVSQCNVLIPIHVYKITFSKSLLSYTPHTNLAKCLPLRTIYTFLGLLPSFGKCQSTIWFCTSKQLLKINLTGMPLCLNENKSLTVYFLIDYSFSLKSRFLFLRIFEGLSGAIFSSSPEGDPLPLVTASRFFLTLW